MKDITNCDLCGNSDSESLFNGHDLLHGNPGDFSFRQCKVCGLIYLTPQPDEDVLELYYPEDYHAFLRAIEDEESWFKRMDRQYGLRKKCQNVIKRTVSTGRLLDVGCGTGIFLNGMRKYGWDVYGVEPSATAVQYARERFNIDIHKGFLEEADYQENFFDAVTMWDVLEHVPNPRKTLSEIARILKPGGCLFLNLPNPSSLERKWFGKYWAGWDIPRHTFIFSLDTLDSYFRTVGLEYKEVISFIGKHGALVLNFRFLFTDWDVSERIKQLAIRVINSLPVRIITMPFYYVISMFNKSSYMVVCARKS